MGKLAHTVTIVFERGDTYVIPTLYDLIQTIQEGSFDLQEVIESSNDKVIFHIKERSDG